MKERRRQRDKIWTPLVKAKDKARMEAGKDGNETSSAIIVVVETITPETVRHRRIQPLLTIATLVKDAVITLESVQSLIQT